MLTNKTKICEKNGQNVSDFEFKKKKKKSPDFYNKFQHVAKIYEES